MADAHLAARAAADSRAKRDVYCDFGNDIKVHAPFDAAALASRLGVTHQPHDD